MKFKVWKNEGREDAEVLMEFESGNKAMRFRDDYEDGDLHARLFNEQLPGEIYTIEVVKDGD